MVRRGGNIGKYFSSFLRLMIWPRLCTLFLSAPMLVPAQRGNKPAAAHALHRPNCSKKARAIGKTALQNTAVRAA